jgi:DNA-binding XRE family transcriptional regulator
MCYHRTYFDDPGIGKATTMPRIARPPADTDDSRLVRRARDRLGLSQAELGKRVGRARRAIIEYEQGGDLPTSVRLAIQYLLTKHKRNRRKKNG